MRKFLAALALIASPALAQSYDGGGAVAADWPANNGEKNNPTGSAPADAIEPADVSDSGFTESQWIDATDGTTDYPTTPGLEKKFRITCEPGTAKILDPILYNGVAPPVGHRHQGTGNVGWNQNSTFATLRAAPSSSCSGGPLNGVAYWEPEMLKTMSNGLVVGVRQQDDSFYYIAGIIGNANDHTWNRRNFAFIGGANPNDYNDTANRAELAAEGYQYPGSPETPAGMIGWQCYRGDGTNMEVTRVASQMRYPNGGQWTTNARHLKGPGGEDPWGGTCTGSVASPGLIIGNLIGPGCWDRTNLRAPDGRGHTRQPAGKADSSISGACPIGWGIVPQLTVKRQYYHTGFSDYGTWYLASDRMNTFATAGDAASLDPCRVTTGWFCPGSTLHFDWMNGWKSGIADEWQRECLGITVRGVAPTNGPAECNSSQISKFRKLKYGGTSPDSAMSAGCTTILSCSNAVPGNIQRYNPLAAGTSATVTIGHVH